jgi:hypothetical protein
LNYLLLLLRFRQFYREAGDIGIFRALFVLVLVLPVAGLFLVQKIAVYPYSIGVPAVAIYLVWVVHQSRKDYRFLLGLTPSPGKIFFAEYALFTLPVPLLLLLHWLWIHALTFILLLAAISATVPQVHRPLNRRRSARPYSHVTGGRPGQETRSTGSTSSIAPGWFIFTRKSRISERNSSTSEAIHTNSVSDSALPDAGIWSLFTRRSRRTGRYDSAGEVIHIKSGPDAASSDARVRSFVNMIKEIALRMDPIFWLPLGTFEWQSGLRKNRTVIVLFWITGLAGFVHIGFSAFSVFMLTLVVTTFYTETEPLPMLRAMELPPGRLLVWKLSQHMALFAMLLLPVVAAAGTHLSLLPYTLGYYLASLNLAAFAILLKYNNYRPGAISGAHQLATTLACILSVVLPAAVLVLAANVILFAGALKTLAPLLNENVPSSSLKEKSLFISLSRRWKT